MMKTVLSHDYAPMYLKICGFAPVANFQVVLPAFLSRVLSAKQCFCYVPLFSSPANVRLLSKRVATQFITNILRSCTIKYGRYTRSSQTFWNLKNLKY